MASPSLLKDLPSCTTSFTKDWQWTLVADLLKGPLAQLPIASWECLLIESPRHPLSPCMVTPGSPPWLSAGPAQGRLRGAGVPRPGYRGPMTMRSSVGRDKWAGCLFSLPAASNLPMGGWGDREWELQAQLPALNLLNQAEMMLPNHTIGPSQSKSWMPRPAPPATFLLPRQAPVSPSSRWEVGWGCCWGLSAPGANLKALGIQPVPGPSNKTLPKCVGRIRLPVPLSQFCPWPRPREGKGGREWCAAFSRETKRKVDASDTSTAGSWGSGSYWSPAPPPSWSCSLEFPLAHIRAFPLMSALGRVLQISGWHGLGQQVSCNGRVPLCLLQESLVPGLPQTNLQEHQAGTAYLAATQAWISGPSSRSLASSWVR